ncbi:MAG: M23 family metallopeptidase [Peptococcaceae bacterium]|nr:M23 family metallopeptidase [Peptococcaceae bacterium]
MPPNLEGQRRLPGREKFILALAYAAIVRQWFLRQSIPRRVGLGAALYLLLALTAYAVFGGNACAVKVNGKVVAVAADEKSARGALGELIRLKSGQAGRPVAVAEKVTCAGIRARQEDVLDQQALLAKLEDSLTFRAKAAAILVNGEARVFLKDKDDAGKLLAWLKTVYPAEPGDQLGFKEKVEVAEILADTGSILDLEAARNLVLLGTSKFQQYTVREGDTLWDIARAAKIDMDQIVFTNPGLDPDHLDVGQVLHLSREAPLITVVATREVTVDEEIPCPVEVKSDDKLLLGERVVIRRGVPGQRTVTYRITRENGLETGREILAQNVTREATPEVVVSGTQAILASRGGQIRLSWPASGGIESPFGRRWGRMHEGIDIGASYGSSVTASAGGTVTGAGWEGGYGKTVEISHGGGLVTRYAHLSSINVSVGQRVERGQLIGLVGATGNTTGPHLHFEVLINGEPRNPVNYLP